MELYVDIRKQCGSFQLRANFRAEEGITGVLGASGSGKSLTLRCIAGIERPDSGVIRLGERILFDSERKIDLPPQQRRVGYLFQNYALFPHMTVEQNILAGLHRIKGDARREKLTELCGLLRLRGLESRRPGQLSGGEQQRVALARILAAEPELLLLDEPFSALDAHLRETLQPGLRSLLRQLGLQTLLVTHDREEAFRMCGQLRILDNGRVLCAGATREVFAQPKTVAAARITGCRNLAPACRRGEHLVEVPEWGVTLTTSAPVPETLCAVGIHVRAFRQEERENAFRVVWGDTLGETALFRFEGQCDRTEELWWQTSGEELPQRLYVAPEDVLLLTEEEC